MRFSNFSVTAALLAAVGAGALALAGSEPIIADPVKVDVGGKYAANETTVSSLFTNPLEIITAYNDWRDGKNDTGIVRMYVSMTTDGTNWVDVNVRPPKSNQSTVEGDPMTCYDDRTGTLWVGGMTWTTAGGIYVAKKKPGVNEFEASVMARKSSGIDKGWMTAGIDPSDSSKTLMCIAYNEGSIVSNDMGATWAAPKSLGSGQGFLPRIGPDGTLYISYWDYSSKYLLKRSTDGGKNFSTAKTIATRLDSWGLYDKRTPGNFRIGPFAYMAVDPNDSTLYAIYADTTNRKGNDYNEDIYFTSSTDKGDHWSKPKVINSDTAGTADSFFPWLEVDRRGRIHAFYFDTRNKSQHDSDASAFIDAYYSYSDDKGDTWHEYRLTPNYFDSQKGGWWFIGDYTCLVTANNRAYSCFPSTIDGDLNIYVNTIIDPRGDMNCDGWVDFNDIDGFVTALVSEEGYVATYPDCVYQNGDINGDGSVDFNDIDPFVTFVSLTP